MRDVTHTVLLRLDFAFCAVCVVDQSSDGVFQAHAVPEGSLTVSVFQVR